LHARQERLEIKRTRRFPSPKDLARKLGHLDEYLDYLLASELTHGSTISQATRSRHPAPNTVHIYARSDNEAVLVGAGLFGARAAIRALRACEVIFDWARDGTQELLDEAADGNDVARAPGHWDPGDGVVQAKSPDPRSRDFVREDAVSCCAQRARSVAGDRRDNAATSHGQERDKW
jgi:hypothetical protein